MKKIEKHLYEQDGRYYARFVCWDKVRRTFPLGDDLGRAKAELKIYRRKDDGEFDYGKREREEREAREREEREQRESERQKSRPTVASFMPRFLESKKNLPSYSFYTTCGWHLIRHLGAVPLEEITRAKIEEYKHIRLTEPIYRYGKGKKLKAVEGTKVRPSTVNREITTTLIGLLNLAANPDNPDDRVLDRIPGTKKLKDAEDLFARDNALSQGEYQALLDASPRWLQRVIIAGYESCLSRVDLLTLTFDEVHRKRPEAAIIKVAGGRNKTKAKQKVPISPELWAVLDEIEMERRKVTSLQAPNLVFTRDGKPIRKDQLRKAYDRAKATANLPDLHFHDLRHCAVTRWTLAGIPEELRRIAAGHRNKSVHGRYFNPSDEEVVSVFAERLGWGNVQKMCRSDLLEKRQFAK